MPNNHSSGRTVSRAAIWNVKTHGRYVGTVLGCLWVFLPVAALALPTVSVVATDNTAAEFGSPGDEFGSSGALTFTLSEPVPGQTVTVAFSISGSATPNADYAALTSPIIFGPGEITTVLRVNPMLDDIAEGDETVTVTLDNGEGYDVGTLSSATVSISDAAQSTPSPVVTISPGPNNPIETGETGESTGFFLIEVNQPAPTSGLTIGLTTAGTATAQDEGDGDYIALPRTARIPAGERSVRVSLLAIPDDLNEGSESVIVQLQPGDGYSLASRFQATLFILDEAPPTSGGTDGPSTSGTPGVVAEIRDTGTRTAATSSTKRIFVTAVDGNGNPVSHAAVQWQLDSAGTAAGGSLSAADNATNDDGQGAVTLNTAALPATYTLNVTITSNNGGGTSTATSQVVVLAGLANAVTLNTPEGRIAVALDTICARLNASGTSGDREAALLTRCNQLLTAAQNGEDAAVNNALRRIAPEEIAAQRRVSRQAAERAVGDVFTRLYQLRHGARGVDLNNLTFRTSEDALSAAMLTPLFTQENIHGGSAGDGDLWQDERWGLFASGHFGDGERDRTAHESGYNVDTQGATFGVDYRQSDKFIYGVAFTYGNSDTQMQDNGGSLDTNGLGLTAYATYYRTEQLYFEGVAGFGKHDFESTRSLDYTLNAATVSSQTNGSTTGTQQSVTLGAGYEQSLPQGFQVDWSGRIGMVSHDIDGYAESGDQAFDLAIGSQAYESLTLSVGAQLQRAFSRPWGVTIPMLRLAWEHDTKGASTINGTFVADTQNTEFSFNTDAWDKDYLRAAAGLSAILRNGTVVFVSYESVLARNNYNENELSFGARWQRNF